MATLMAGEITLQQPLENSCRQRVLYNPLLWMHPQRRQFNPVLNTPRCHAVLNDMIIAHYRLPLAGINAGRIESLFITYWHLLPQVGLRLAALRYRARLALGGELARLDPAVRQFALLDLIPALPADGTLLGPDELWQLALQQLWQYQPQLSAAVTRRLPLLFPPALTGPVSVPESAGDPLLLQLAIRHAC